VVTLQKFKSIPWFGDFQSIEFYIRHVLTEIQLYMYV